MYLNFFIGKGVEGEVAGAKKSDDAKAKGKKKNFGTFAVRSYVSTFIGQFVDNLVFALVPLIKAGCRNQNTAI